MKRISLKLNLLLVSILVLTSLQIFAQTSQPFSINTSPLPAPTSPVMDYANVLDAATKQQLEQKIIQFRDSTNPKVELAVAIVSTTGDRDIFDYSLAVARGWGIGSKESDNPGALLFIAVNDRKYFTQVSRDLEDELPDGVVGSLQRQYLVPAFKQQQYGKGVSDTIDAYIRTIRAKQNGEPTPEIANQKSEISRSGGISGIMTCLIILFVLMILIFSRGGRGGGGNNGGRGGFGGGGFGGALPWIIGSVIANSGRSSGSSGSGWGGSSGGGWGGFGGGGSFGGGGAGGSW
ncbi:MAG: TPM domain-containing protein [Pyrinomonadaceae bacterium]